MGLNCASNGSHVRLKGALNKSKINLQVRPVGVSYPSHIHEGFPLLSIYLSFLRQAILVLGYVPRLLYALSVSSSPHVGWVLYFLI